MFAQEVPSEAKKLYENAVEALERQQIAQGIEGLEQSLKIFPNYFLALERLGLEELNREKFLIAKKLLGDCVRVNPRSFRCWYGLGYSAYSLQEYSDAVDALKRTVEIDASSAASFFVLGLSQGRMGQYQDAEDSMLKAKALDNGRTSAINWNLALLYAHNLKRYKDAAAELELFLEADPKNPDAGNIKKLIKQFQNRSTNP